ncbi:hypothetical protein IQ249_19965 [Lusitaniella coriacea LEGE 07157]|uniref:Uncharacterized protein n=1 Tax=Lusitaniella coriacea LEGE 07157 TaxID=945747 RepID=A0A8J7E0V0_9CYAN|nr:hypothetical protein [Lusitaniella coriacea]MBE9118173.1 hypothetical protein [Lusitaniella coriacea LEGE 07157]
MKNCDLECAEMVLSQPANIPYSEHLEFDFWIAQQDSQDTSAESETSAESRIRSLELQVETLDSQVEALNRKVSRLQNRVSDYTDGGIALVLVGSFCALWAQNTGRNAWSWFFLGTWFAPITLLVLLSKNSSDRRSRK